MTDKHASFEVDRNFKCVGHCFQEGKRSSVKKRNVIDHVMQQAKSPKIVPALTQLVAQHYSMKTMFS